MGFSKLALDTLIARGTQLQVQLRDAPQQLGPGKVEKAFTDKECGRGDGTIHIPESASAAQDLDGYYMITVEAMLQATPNSRPGKVSLPIVFHIDEVTLVIGAPVNLEGSPIVMAAPGRGGGGLHIPGGA